MSLRSRIEVALSILCAPCWTVLLQQELLFLLFAEVVMRIIGCDLKRQRLSDLGFPRRSIHLILDLILSLLLLLSFTLSVKKLFDALFNQLLLVLIQLCNSTSARLSIVKVRSIL